MNLARAQRAIGPFVEAAPTLAVLTLLVLAGWLAARWVLYFAAPAEVPAVSGRERVPLGVAAQALSDAHLFGVAPAGAGGDAVSNLNIKLRGVFASRADAASMAIINTGDRDETARVGGEIVPGVVLEAVHPEYVMLRRNGALERVNLEEPQRIAAAPRAPPQRRAQASSPAPQTALLAPPRGPAARFQRPEPYAPVGDVPTEPAPVAAPAPPQAPPPAPVPTPGAPGASPGLVIQSVPPGSLLERVGLQPGDVVRSVNGEVVTSEADVARILQSRGLQGPFTAEVQRGGVVVPISVNAPR